MVVGAKVCELTEDLLWFVCGLYVGILTFSLILKECLKLNKMHHHTMSCYVASWVGYSCGTEDPRTIQYGCVEGGGWGFGQRTYIIETMPSYTLPM